MKNFTDLTGLEMEEVLRNMVPNIRKAEQEKRASEASGSTFKNKKSGEAATEKLSNQE